MKLEQRQDTDKDRARKKATQWTKKKRGLGQAAIVPAEKITQTYFITFLSPVVNFITTI